MMRLRKLIAATTDNAPSGPDPEKNSLSAAFARAPSPPPSASASAGPNISHTRGGQREDQGNQANGAQQPRTFRPPVYRTLLHKSRDQQAPPQPTGQQRTPQQNDGGGQRQQQVVGNKRFVSLSPQQDGHLDRTLRRFNVSRRPLGEAANNLIRRPPAAAPLSRRPPGELAAAAANTLGRPAQPTNEGFAPPSFTRPLPPTSLAGAAKGAANNSGDAAETGALRAQSAAPQFSSAPSESEGRRMGPRPGGMGAIGGLKADLAAKGRLTPSTGGDAENGAVRAQFGTPQVSSDSGEGEGRRFGFRGAPRIGGMKAKLASEGRLAPTAGTDAERGALRSGFTETRSTNELRTESSAEHAARGAERDAQRAAEKKAEGGAIEAFYTKPSSESAPAVAGESGKSGEALETEASRAQEMEKRNSARVSRSSKFAVDEEDDAPRQRKAKGGRTKASSHDDDAADHDYERKSKKKDKRRQRAAEVVAAVPIYLPEYLSVVSLANKLRVRTESLVRKMEELGFEDINNDDILNAENAGLIAMEYNFEPVAVDPSQDRDLYPAPEPEDWSALPARPPVVTIMGHVDHGKTTLLDYLRKSSVAATEFGGITQHIGAFSVPLSSGKTITFLDTPGHAAFLSMRQRGATVTDIVILVVAADDSVKPQTIEAIKHAKSARVPIIVAINKIDKEGANLERVKQDLARNGVDVEDYGGDVQAIPVSGKTGAGMQDLEEAAITLSEILDHRAAPDGPVEGWVLEASTKKSGKVATVLVRRGTLRVGSIIVAGQTFARVRTMKNEAGVDIPAVGPGMPAEIDGWRGQPEAGDEVLEAEDEQRATEAVEFREANAERVQMAKDMEAINEARRLEQEKRAREEAREKALAAAAEAGEEDPEAAVAAAEAAEAEEVAPGVTEVPFIVKADVSGSVEAVVDYVMTVGNGEVRPRVIRAAVGPVSEFDIEYAATAGGHVVSFNVALEPRLARVAETKGVRVLEQNVIYRLVDDVKGVLSEKLAPTVVQRVSGEASVLEVFTVTVGRAKNKQLVKIAGCRVANGQVQRGSKVRVFRGGEKVYDGMFFFVFSPIATLVLTFLFFAGTVSSLKMEKKDVTEMRKGTECGMAFEGWGDFQKGDSIQCYEEKFEKRYL